MSPPRHERRVTIARRVWRDRPSHEPDAVNWLRDVLSAQGFDLTRPIARGEDPITGAYTFAQPEAPACPD